MAITNEQLLVQIEVNTKDAQKSVNNLEKEFISLRKEVTNIDKSTSVASKALTGFGAAMLAVNNTAQVARMAFSAVTKAASFLTKDFIEASDVSLKLSNTLQLFGDYTPAIVEDFKQWSTAIENTTANSAKLALTMVTLGKNMGLSNEQSKEMVEVAANLSAITGDSLQMSFENLAKTLRGQARGLGEVGILLSDLTDEELRAGKGIERLAEIFDGQAQASMSTFGKQVELLGHKIGEIIEPIGEMIFRIFDVEANMASASKAIANMAAWIEKNKEKFIVWGKFVTQTLSSVMSLFAGVIFSIETALRAIITGVYKLAEGVVFLGTKLKIFSPETYEKTAEAANEMYDSIGLAGNSAVEAFKDAYTNNEMLNEKMKQTAPTIKAAGAAFKGMSFEAKQTSEELIKIIDELEKKLISTRIVGTSEEAIINSRKEASLKELKITEDRLLAMNQLKGRQLELLNLNRAAAESLAQNDIGELQRKNLEELTIANKDLYLQLNRDAMTQSEIIDYQNALFMEQLDIKMKNKTLDDAGIKALKDQQKLVNQIAKKQKQEAGSSQYQALEKAGKDIGKNISDTFKSGAASMVGGLASAATSIMSAVTGVISMVNALLDFIPQVLNGISDIFDKATDLPNAILRAVERLGGSLTKFITDFIPNLYKAIPQILNSIVDLIFIGIPKALETLLGMLPEIIVEYMNKLIEMLPRVISLMITHLPKLAIALTQGLIKGAPQIAIAMVKAMAYELPKAIIKGIIEGAKQLLNILSGKGIKIDLDPQKISNAAKDLGKKLSGEAAKLFSVIDMEAAQRQAEKAQEIEKAVTAGIDKIKGFWQKMIDWLVDAWHKIIAFVGEAWNVIINSIRAVFEWVYTKILEPLIGFVQVAFQWVIDNVIMPLLTIGQQAFQWVYDNIVMRLLTIGQQAFQWVYDNIILPLMTIGQRAFQWVTDNTIKPLTTIGQTSFSWVYKNIVTPLLTIGQKAFAWVFTNIVTPLKTIGTVAFSWVQKNIVAPLQSIANIFKGFKFPSFKWPKINFTWPEIPAPKWLKDLGIGGSSGSSAPSTGVPVIDNTVGAVVSGTKEVAKKADPRNWSTGGLVYAANGMFIPKGTDTVPAMLTPGEFVINRGAVQELGLGAMQSINKGVAPVNNVSVNISLDIKTTETIDENFVRSRLMPKLKDELRRASLDGQFILSAKGIR